MANPNIINTTTILAKTVSLPLATSNSTIINNALDSNNIIKINSIIASNFGNVSCDVLMIFQTGANSTTIAGNITVPTKSILVLVSKDYQLYLEENCSIIARASVSNTLSMTASYEVIT
jgi:hypothetical protein